MIKTNSCFVLIVTVVSLLGASCVPNVVLREPSTKLPDVYFLQNEQPQQHGAQPAVYQINDWRSVFTDTVLVNLIEQSVENNQELQIISQEVQVAINEVSARNGEFLPSVEVGAHAGLEKTPLYSPLGAVEENLTEPNGAPFPSPLTNFGIGADVSWEIDIWAKLRNATEAARLRFFASEEGLRFTTLVLMSEVAKAYYELQALDNVLMALQTNTRLVTTALEIVREQKEAAKSTELAVKRFEAELAANESRKAEIDQRIIETQTKIASLLGVVPFTITRNAESFFLAVEDSVKIGSPADLINNRPDLREARRNYEAAQLELSVARAEFYPSLRLNTGVGFNATQAAVLFSTPASLVYGLAGDLMTPIINRNVIEANYRNAAARQIQASLVLDRKSIDAFIAVSNKAAKLNNLSLQLTSQQQQVTALVAAVEVSTNLFQSARADYLEVLLSQREALEANIELVETQLQRINTKIELFMELGGTW